MKTTTRLEQLLVNCLNQSMPVDTMVKLVKHVISGYDVHERSGFPPSIPIPSKDAARQIVDDLKNVNLTKEFLEKLIDVYRNGLMGRRVNLRYLQQIIAEVESIGFYFNNDYGIFVEKNESRITSGWGILNEGVIYEFSFLSIDIVNNSEMVRRHTREEITKTYTYVKSLVQKIVERRNGRLWNWEGDGGLFSFYFQDKNIKAVLCAMEILSELYLYNQFQTTLNEPLRVRMAIHTGPCQYFTSIQDIQNETLRKLEIQESNYTKPDHLSLSPGVYSDLGRKLEKFFTQTEISKGNNLYTYSLKWEP